MLSIAPEEWHDIVAPRIFFLFRVRLYRAFNCGAAEIRVSNNVAIRLSDGVGDLDIGDPSLTQVFVQSLEIYCVFPILRGSSGRASHRCSGKVFH